MQQIYLEKRTSPFVLSMAQGSQRTLQFRIDNVVCYHAGVLVVDEMADDLP